MNMEFSKLVTCLQQRSVCKQSDQTYTIYIGINASIFVLELL